MPLDDDDKKKTRAPSRAPSRVPAAAPAGQARPAASGAAATPRDLTLREARRNVAPNTIPSLEALGPLQKPEVDPVNFGRPPTPGQQAPARAPSRAPSRAPAKAPAKKATPNPNLAAATPRDLTLREARRNVAPNTIPSLEVFEPLQRPEVDFGRPPTPGQQAPARAPVATPTPLRPSALQLPQGLAGAAPASALGGRQLGGQLPADGGPAGRAIQRAGTAIGNVAGRVGDAAGRVVQNIRDAPPQTAMTGGVPAGYAGTGAVDSPPFKQGEFSAGLGRLLEGNNSVAPSREMAQSAGNQAPAATATTKTAPALTRSLQPNALGGAATAGADPATGTAANTGSRLKSFAPGLGLPAAAVAGQGFQAKDEGAPAAGGGGVQVTRGGSGTTRTERPGALPEGSVEMIRGTSRSYAVPDAQGNFTEIAPPASQPALDAARQSGNTTDPGASTEALAQLARIDPRLFAALAPLVAAGQASASDERQSAARDQALVEREQLKQNARPPSVEEFIIEQQALFPNASRESLEEIFYSNPDNLL